MAPTPINSTGRITIRYKPFSIVHALNLFVDPVATATGDASGYDLSSHHVGTPDIGATAFIAELKSKMAPLFHTSMVWVDWTLWQYSVPNYIPVYSAAVSGNGTEATNVDQKTAQNTFVYRTGLYHLAKVELFETWAAVPAHLSSVGSPFDAFYNAFLDRATGKLGSFVSGRDATMFATFKAFTASLNRKLRRKGGFI